jgi:hypothetical protein
MANYAGCHAIDSRAFSHRGIFSPRPGRIRRSQRGWHSATDVDRGGATVVFRTWVFLQGEHSRIRLEIRRQWKARSRTGPDPERRPIDTYQPYCEQKQSKADDNGADAEPK